MYVYIYICIHICVCMLTHTREHKLKGHVSNFAQKLGMQYIHNHKTHKYKTQYIHKYKLPFRSETGNAVHT